MCAVAKLIRQTPLSVSCENEDDLPGEVERPNIEIPEVDIIVIEKVGMIDDSNLNTVRRNVTTPKIS